MKKMKLKRNWQGVMVGLLLSLTLALPVPARADGGIIISDPELWPLIEEGMQIAVVRLGKEEDTAQVDLFVSLLDASGQSHEITFFLPLGSHPTVFDVVEENSIAFQAAQTKKLDGYLADAAEQEETYRSVVRPLLLPGTLLLPLTSWAGWGYLLWTLWLGPVFENMAWSTAGLADIAPAATFRTEHSVIELYDIDADTDLEALIATTGLQPAVQETLRRLEGQQIAVIKMQTQPAGKSKGGARVREYDYLAISNQQGLHLKWSTRLVPGDGEGTYAYPLGTGSAWARPIELTPVYAFAPPGVDFRVAYPKLGKNRSGYVITRGFGFPGRPKPRPRPRILSDTDTPGYAVDQAVGDFGHVWRAIYVQSNAAEDVVVTRVEGLLLKTRVALFLRPVVQQWAMRFTWAVGLLAAFVIWGGMWRFVMPRQLGFSYRWLDFKLWRHALGWALVHLASMVVALMAGFGLSFLIGYIGLLISFQLYQSLTMMSLAVMLGLPALTSFGIVSGFLFTRSASRRMGIPRRKAAGAYALVVTASNFAYGLFALAYLALVGGL